LIPIRKVGIFFAQNFLFMLLKRFFVRKPKRKLKWTPEDYVMGKEWALTQPHPFKRGKTLWDFVYDKYEYVRTVENLNKYLFNEI
jgi:hypothetical protein